MGGAKVVLIQPHSGLSSCDDGDHYMSLGYLYLIIKNVRATPIRIDNTRVKFKCVSPHNRLLEVWTRRVPHVLQQVHNEH